jgi:hypothetical protein
MTSRTPRERNIPNTAKLRDRGLWCRRLALGVADPKFAATVKMISDEYEVTVQEMDTSANSLDK